MTAEAPLRMLSFRPGTSKVVFKKVRSMMISCNPVGKLECVKHHPRSLDSICFRFTAKYIIHLTENYLPSGMKLYHLRVSLVMLSWVKNSKLCYRTMKWEERIWFSIAKAGTFVNLIVLSKRNVFFLRKTLLKG